ncbi:MAG: chorismate-binding protein [Bacteroides sp.]|nr:chorismate-binding protein [Bacteroides sp.]
MQQNIYQQIARIHRSGMTFAACQMPGEDSFKLFVAPSASKLDDLRIDCQEFDSFQGFVFNKFALGKTLESFGIPAIEGNVEIVDTHAATASKANDYTGITSTSHEGYVRKVEDVIASIDGDNEKVVYSRIVVCDSDIDPVDVAKRYFAMHPRCFRYILHISGGATWIGATPELLMDYSASESSLQTMSLAGTRVKAESGSEWDKKNRLEHNMVTDHIVSTLENHGYEITDNRETSIAFGDIEHLCHQITAKGRGRLSDLLPDFSPTPALCGYPRSKAYEKIVEYEDFDRELYGGFVGVKDADRTRLFVNLRCAKVIENVSGGFKYVLFGGGGLTRRSSAESEWIETQNKMRSLFELVNNIKTEQ